MRITQPIKNYLNEKINKHETFLKDALLIQAELTNLRSHQGVDNNFKLEISVNMPKAFLKVEDTGADVYALVNKLEQLLKRRLKRYHDLHRKWQGNAEWKLANLPNYFVERKTTDIKDYEPIIKKRKSYKNDSPIHPAEAIEQMELLGHSSFLFRNIETNSYAMVYRRQDGHYGLVEPPK